MSQRSVTAQPATAPLAIAPLRHDATRVAAGRLAVRIHPLLTTSVHCAIGGPHSS